MSWRRHKREREHRLAEAKAAFEASERQVERSRITLHRAYDIGLELKRGRERNHYSQALSNLIERGRP